MMLCIYDVTGTTTFLEVNTIATCQAAAGSSSSYIAQSSIDYIPRVALSGGDIEDIQQYAVVMFAAAFGISLLKRLFR